MTVEPKMKRKIDTAVSKLGHGYLKALARKAFGKATKGNIRKVKYWRTGKMKDIMEVERIILIANQIAIENEPQKTPITRQ